MEAKQSDIQVTNTANKLMLTDKEAGILAREEQMIRSINIAKGFFNLVIGSIFTYCVFMIGFYAVYKANDSGTRGYPEAGLFSVFIVYGLTCLFGLLTLWKGFGTMQQKVEITEERKAEILGLHIPSQLNYENMKQHRFDHYFLWGSGVLFVIFFISAQSSFIIPSAQGKLSVYIANLFFFIFIYAFINFKRHHNQV